MTSIVCPTIKHDYIDTLNNYPTMSEENDFIPIFALNNGISYKKGDKKVLTYEFRYSLSFESCIETKKSVDFVDSIRFADLPQGRRWRSMKAFGDVDKTSYIATGGFLYAVPPGDNVIAEPLILLCIRKRFLFKLDRDNINKDAFTAIVSKKLISDVRHARIYRMVKKHYIDVALQSDTNILFTDDIMKLCFNSTNLIKAPKAKTLIEMKEALAETNKDVLTYLFDDTVVLPDKSAPEAIIDSDLVEEAIDSWDGHEEPFIDLIPNVEDEDDENEDIIAELSAQLEDEEEEPDPADREEDDVDLPGIDGQTFQLEMSEAPYSENIHNQTLNDDADLPF